MPSTRPSRDSLRASLLLVVAFTAAYAAAVALGRASRVDGTPVALVWPAAGVGVLWLAMFWSRVRWRIASAALLSIATFVGNTSTGAPIELAAAFTVANLGQAVVSCAVLGRIDGSLAAARGVAGLMRIAGAAALGSAVGAVLGPASLAVLSISAWPVEPAMWIFRNGVSMFVLVAGAAAIRAFPLGETIALRRLLECAGVLVVAALINVVVFAGAAGIPVAFAIVPAAVYVGIRCSVPAAAAHGLTTWIVVAFYTFSSRGPFSGYSLQEQVILVQALVGVVAFLTLALALGKAQEHDLARRLGTEQAFVSAVVGQLASNLVVCDEFGTIREFDPQSQMLRAAHHDLRPEQWPSFFGVYEADGSRMLDPGEVPLYRALHGEQVEETPLLVRGPDGGEISYLVAARPIVDPAGRLRGAVARTTDITELRRIETELRLRATDMDELAAIGRELAAATDIAAARQSICAAARRSARADVTMLFEPDPSGEHLTCSAAEGTTVDFVVPLTGPPSGTAIAYASGKAFFVGDAVGHPALNHEIIGSTGLASAIWQPVIREGKAIAVLAVGWREQRDALPDRVDAMLELLAVEASVAIERSSLIARLDDLARTDPLTGAHNRRSLQERIVEHTTTALRAGSPVCMLMADIDHFKRYNDTHGHQDGDRLLKAAVAAWTQEVRPADTVARYGGEEFAIVLHDCGLEDARRLADRLRGAMPDAQTVSIGIAEWDGEETSDAWIARADASLYRAKRAGRDRVEVAERAPR